MAFGESYVHDRCLPHVLAGMEEMARDTPLYYCIIMENILRYMGGFYTCYTNVLRLFVARCQQHAGN